MHVYVTLREIQTIWQANKFAHIPLGTLKHNSLQSECNVCVCVCVWRETECGIAADRHWTSVADEARIRKIEQRVQHGNSSVTLKRVQRGNWPFTLKGVAWQFVSHVKGRCVEIGLSFDTTQHMLG